MEKIFGMDTDAIYELIENDEEISEETKEKVKELRIESNEKLRKYIETDRKLDFLLEEHRKKANEIILDMNVVSINLIRTLQGLDEEEKKVIPETEKSKLKRLLNGFFGKEKND